MPAAFTGNCGARESIIMTHTKGARDKISGAFDIQVYLAQPTIIGYLILAVTNFPRSLTITNSFIVEYLVATALKVMPPLGVRVVV